MRVNRYVDLYLIRHWITDWNREKRYLGHTDQNILMDGLDELDLLKTEFEDLSFDSIYSSDLLRCQNTLKFLSLCHSPNLDPRLREMNFGDWEGKKYEELKEDPCYQRWLDNWELHSTPSGESGQMFQRRVDAFVSDMLDRFRLSRGKSTILVMTHGGVIRYMLSQFKATNSFWESPAVPHGKGLLLKLENREGDWVCNSLSVVPIAEKER
ncbi:histidine phosphatase family protein [Bacillus sp. RO2]|uniref:histidine phosphatase family protein n=1 Tax=Bacillus sp. RO2 TaxID=2723913 RepID=UPI00145CBBC7|nr:histidine phosphatase family protein [Bacillus sp. RO2]NMH74611.1 histidine phosphatase family protein [Bacillus sp. RO2]